MAFNIALILSLSIKFKSIPEGGLEVSVGLDGDGSDLPDEKRQRYERILDKIEQGVPLKEIQELHDLIEEVDAEDERRRAFRSYRQQYYLRMKELAAGNVPPSADRLVELLKTLRVHPLSPSPLATPRMLRSAFKPHPYLAGDEFIDAGFLHHLIASNFTDNEVAHRFFTSVQKRYGKGQGKNDASQIEDCFVTNYNFPIPEFDKITNLLFEESIFVFTGKFAFGSRKACQNAVTKRGALVSKNVTRETDYLVVASGWENTSPRSSKLQGFYQVRDKGCPCFLISEEQWKSYLLDS
jgi:DNA-binding transcriptional MerR regulator